MFARSGLRLHLMGKLWREFLAPTTESQLAALAAPEAVKASPDALDSVFVAPVSQVSFPSLTMRCHFSSEVSYLLLPSQAV